MQWLGPSPQWDGESLAVNVLILLYQILGMAMLCNWISTLRVVIAYYASNEHSFYRTQFSYVVCSYTLYVCTCMCNVLHTYYIELFTISYCIKNFILKYFRCRDGKRTETRIGMEGICITHSCIPLYTVYMQHIMAHSGGMQEWVIQIPSIPILVSVLFPSLHLRIKFLLLVCIVFMRMRTKLHLHPVIS